MSYVVECRRREGPVTDLSCRISATVMRLREEISLDAHSFGMLMGISDAMVGALDRQTRNWTTSMIERATRVLRVEPSVLLMPEEEFICPACGGDPGKNRMCLYCRKRDPAWIPGYWKGEPEGPGEDDSVGEATG